MDTPSAILKEKVPENAVEYCHNLWLTYPFQFKLRKSRVSKLGDYRFDPRSNSHMVTVNSDLNPYQFLITYVHEVAHRVVHQPRGRQKPHGIEWKTQFRDLMLPLLKPDVFPDELLRPLARHMRNPKASVAGDPVLARALSKFDMDKQDLLTLADINLGQEFILRKRSFRKLEKKRTRAMCLDLANGKRYLISELAEVTPQST